MENFTAYNPVSLHFGKDVTSTIGETTKKYGQRVLFVYGKGSVVRNGYYEIIKTSLDNSSLEIFDFSGIRPNPIADDVREAVKIGIDNKIDVIVALGGGSVIDSAKAISVCIPENLDVWDVYIRKSVPTKSIPLICVLTLAATGTEMNPFAVIQNPETGEKLGFGLPLMYPKHSFLDPQFTYSVPADYTGYGIADLIAHTFESFFGAGDAGLSDRFVASIVLEAMKYAPLVLDEPLNYDYRANIMWQATVALNGTCNSGRIAGDWGVHSIGHILSIMYDTAHGASLSIAYPAWLKVMKEIIPERISKLSELIFGSNDIDLFIKKLEDFFVSIFCPIRLADIGIADSEKPKTLENMIKNSVGGYNYKLSDELKEKILSFM